VTRGLARSWAGTHPEPPPRDVVRP
jgi:hypothetical protein